MVAARVPPSKSDAPNRRRLFTILTEDATGATNACAVSATAGPPSATFRDGVKSSRNGGELRELIVKKWSLLFT
jgi:hypothetical protein